MSVDPERLARRLLGEHWQQLSRQERETVARIARRVRNPEQEFRDNRTLGERAADAIAAFGGSWTFILLFFGLLIGWTLGNTAVLGPRHEAFDPYPYVFLNLVLSMLAAIQAPIIMMSQNRAAARDRLAAEVDHEVNVRAELAVRDIDRRLHSIERALGLNPHSRPPSDDIPTPP
jgi:uncharacterized membrane protein